MRELKIYIVGLALGGVLGISFTNLYKEYTKPLPTSSIRFVKDPITKCQYIHYQGAMYPRLDDRRSHICSDEKKYVFDPEPGV